MNNPDPEDFCILPFRDYITHVSKGVSSGNFEVFCVNSVSTVIKKSNNIYLHSTCNTVPKELHAYFFKNSFT